MKHLFYLSLTFISALTYCQSIQNLDAKNGFKEFHLGDSKNKWANQLTAIDHSNYNYTGSFSTAFSYPIKKIVLEFNKSDKLIKINIALGDMEKVSLDHLINLISNSFGPPTYTYPSELSESSIYIYENVQYIWKGVSVMGGVLIKRINYPSFEISLIFQDKSVNKTASTDY